MPKPSWMRRIDNVGLICEYTVCKKMEKDAAPSTSQNLDIDFGGRSFVDEHFKGEFMNTLLAARCIYKEHNLLSNKPPEIISSVSLAMAVEISKATINVLKKGIVSMEEELVLFDESDNEGEFMEVRFIMFLIR